MLEDAELAPTQTTESPRERMMRLAMALLQVGVSASQARQLLANHDLDVVEQQLLWLPARKARKRSSLIVSAIRENYEKPADLIDE
jgi:hypothetical protein